MNLRKFDNRRVRITCNNGEVYEGVCEYNNAEYGEIEFGRSEESLEIFNFLFYKNEIASVDILGNFSKPYGKIEEYYTQDGIDEFKDMLFDENKEHIIRLLICVEDRLKETDYPYRYEVIEDLRAFEKYADDEESKAEVKRILEKIGSE
ncbi:MAG: hypothetical protein K6F88_03775 [Ruminococcus sp.]|nr:hypothetical protein [Ruminococcus sp.]